MPPIVRLQLAEVQLLLNDKNITLNATDAAVQWLANDAYDVQYGARPLRRRIQQLVLHPLSLATLGDEIKDGGAVHVTLENRDGNSDGVEVNDFDIDVDGVGAGDDGDNYHLALRFSPPPVEATTTTSTATAATTSE
jgi:hypothetical protein